MPAISETFKNGTLYRFIDGLIKAEGFVKKDMAIAVSYKFQFIFQFTQVFFGVAVIYFIGKMHTVQTTSHLHWWDWR